MLDEKIDRILARAHAHMVEAALRVLGEVLVAHPGEGTQKAEFGLGHSVTVHQRPPPANGDVLVGDVSVAHADET